VSGDAVEKARKVRMVIMDVDGVLTDGRAFYGAGGSEALLFNVHDGTGVKYLQRSGIRTAIISGRDVEAVRARAQTLGVEEVVQGAKVKLDAYEAVRARAGLHDEDIAYIGDDLPDLPAMRRAGLAVAVPNAAPEVLEEADFVTGKRGGEGAVRELAEFLLKAQGKWEQILGRYC
jgi:3-deoxy-D-manno-octulosonate 8-phosphate phosphatase (KDO 8-P phosphatase)